MKKKTSIKKSATYIEQTYSNGLLKLKNMDWFIVCASIYICIFLYEFYLGYIWNQYMICSNKNNICAKTLLEKI